MAHVEYFGSVKGKRPSAFKGGIDEERLNFFSSLWPREYWVGAKEWLGYVIFTFEDSKHVALDCAIRGNAIYMLDEAWNNAARLSKRDITKSPAFLRKIHHKGMWQKTVCDVLWNWHRFPVASVPSD